MHTTSLGSIWPPTSHPSPNPARVCKQDVYAHMHTASLGSIRKKLEAAGQYVHFL